MFSNKILDNFSTLYLHLIYQLDKNLNIQYHKNLI